MIPFKAALSTRWAQMSKQEQIIEKKKMEIQAKLEAQKQAAALAAQVKLANLGSQKEDSKNIFNNDGSFMNQFKALLDKQMREKEEKELLERGPEPVAEDREAGNEGNWVPGSEDYRNDGDDHWNNREEEHSGQNKNDRRRSGDRRNRDRDRNRGRWNDRNQNRHHSPSDHGQEEIMNHDNKNIPSLMQIPVMPPNEQPPGDTDRDRDNQWNRPPVPPNYKMEHGHGPGQNMGSNMGSMMGPGNMPPLPPGHMPPPYMNGPPNFQMPPFMGPNGPNGPMPPFFGPPFPNGPMMGPRGGPMMPPNSMNGNMPPFMGQPPQFGMNNQNRPPNFGNGNGPPMPPFMPPNSMPPNSMPPNPIPPNSMPPNSMLPNSMSQNSMPHMQDNKMEGMPDSMKRPNIPPPPMPTQMLKDVELRDIPLPSSQDVPPAVHRAAAEVARNGDDWENALKTVHSQDPNMWFLHNTNSNEYKAFRNLVDRMRSDLPRKKPEVKPEDKYEPEFSLEDDDSNDIKYPMKEESSRDSYNHPWQQPQYNDGDKYKRERHSSSDEEQDGKRERRRRKKKSRWGDDPPVDLQPPGCMPPLPPGTMPPMPPGSMPPGMMPPGMMPPGMMPPGMLPPGVMPPMPPGPMPDFMGSMAGFSGGPKYSKPEDDMKLTSVNRNNPALMQYAMTNYGSTNLSAEDWKKCEDNFKLNLLYQDMLKKRNEVEKLAAAGKHKYEYDSDEDTAEGTWEHKLRAHEMNATEIWADELTKQAAGKHHIGDFLPPEELKKFMEKYSAAKSGKEPDLSDYKEFKLKEDNLGFKMLQKLGWNEGQGLGAEGTGIVDPINKGNQPGSNLGLGAASGDAVSPDDDEFDAYRKRMMLAYRFRPNPLNNPRRPYY